MSTSKSRGVGLCLALLLLVTAVPASADPSSDLSQLFGQVITTSFANDLTQGERTSLVTKVVGAIADLERGNERSTAGILGAFIHEVEALERSGRLPAADAEALINSASNIVDQL